MAWGNKTNPGPKGAAMLNQEYTRKQRVAAELADAAWLCGGLKAMKADLDYLIRMDADSVVIDEVKRLYYNRIVA
jgi:hypothetical protein